MADTASIDALSHRFVAALEQADAAALEALFAPDFTIWYNFSDQTLDRAAALSFMCRYFSEVRVRFSHIIRHATACGWVQQHRVDADGPDGFILRAMPACLVVTLAQDGRIARIEEYFDSAQTPGFDRSQMAG